MSTPQEQLTAPDLSSFALPPDMPTPAQPRAQRPRVSPPQPKPILDPTLSAHVNDMLGALGQQGYDVRLGETVRTPEQQAEKVAEGVSRTYNSKHLSGQAADLIVYRDGKPDWDTKNPAWQAIGTEAKQRGLRWGGDFKSLYDPGHVELSDETAPNLSQFALPHDAPDLSSFALPDPDKQPLWQRAGLQAPGVAVVREGDSAAGAGEYWWVDANGQKIRRVIAGDPTPESLVDPDELIHVNARSSTQQPSLQATTTKLPELSERPDPYTQEGRAERDALAQAQQDPNARMRFDLHLPAGVSDWSELSSNQLARETVRQYAATHNILPEFTEQWLKEHGDRLHVYDLQTGETLDGANAIRPDTYDPEHRTLRVSAEMPHLLQLKHDYEAWRSPADQALIMTSRVGTGRWCVWSRN